MMFQMLLLNVDAGDGDDDGDGDGGDNGAGGDGDDEDDEMRFQLLWNVDIAFLFAYQDNNFYLVETIINIIIMMHEYDQDQDNGNE